MVAVVPVMAAMFTPTLLISSDKTSIIEVLSLISAACSLAPLEI